MSDALSQTIHIHDIGAPCRRVRPLDEVVADPGERGDVTCWRCLRLANTAAEVEDEHSHGGVPSLYDGC